MEQITNEMRCRIFAAYWGCKTIICYPSSNFPQYSVVDKLFHKSLQDKTESLATHYRWNNLILKPLSSISDEDAIEVARIILSKESDWQPFKIERNAHYSEIIVKIEQDITDADTEITMLIRLWHLDSNPIRWIWEYKKGNSTCINDRGVPNILQSIDYLRSKSYDCGYGSIPSLIAAQIAISI